MHVGAAAPAHQVLDGPGSDLDGVALVVVDVTADRGHIPVGRVANDVVDSALPAAVDRAGMVVGR